MAYNHPEITLRRECKTVVTYRGSWKKDTEAVVCFEIEDDCCFSVVKRGGEETIVGRDFHRFYKLANFE